LESRPSSGRGCWAGTRPPRVQGRGRAGCGFPSPRRWGRGLWGEGRAKAAPSLFSRLAVGLLADAPRRGHCPCGSLPSPALRRRRRCRSLPSAPTLRARELGAASAPAPPPPPPPPPPQRPRPPFGTETFQRPRLSGTRRRRRGGGGRGRRAAAPGRRALVGRGPAGGRHGARPQVVLLGVR
jgi:hypothetical protein